MSMSLPLCFFTGSPGPAELIVIFIAVLLLFGPKKLPDIARSLGKTIDELRRASQDFKDQIMKIEDEDHDALDVPSTDLVDMDDYSNDYSSEDDPYNGSDNDWKPDEDVSDADDDIDELKKSDEPAGKKEEKKDDLAG